MKLSDEQKFLRRRIIEISHQRHFSHLGSCLCAVDSIAAIYKIKQSNERFVLSCGHAGIALYVVLEKCGLLKTSEIDHLHIHPDRASAWGIDVSTGSLGQGLPIAMGMALADRNKNVYCVISDGECAEGSIWESLRVGIEQRVSNLKIIVNANGWGAYASISSALLFKRFQGFGYSPKKVKGHDIKKIMQLLKRSRGDRPLMIFAQTTVEQLPFLKGQDAHYYVMNQTDYDHAMELLK